FAGNRAVLEVALSFDHAVDEVRVQTVSRAGVAHQLIEVHAQQRVPRHRRSLSRSGRTYDWLRRHVRARRTLRGGQCFRHIRSAVRLERSNLGCGYVNEASADVQAGILAGLLFAIKANGEAIAQNGYLRAKGRELDGQQQQSKSDWLCDLH